MEQSLARGGAVKIFNSFLYPTCVNCLGASAVVSLKRSSLLFSTSCGVLFNVIQSVLYIRNNKMMSSEVWGLVHAHRHSRVVQCEV